MMVDEATMVQTRNFLLDKTVEPKQIRIDKIIIRKRREGSCEDIQHKFQNIKIISNLCSKKYMSSKVINKNKKHEPIQIILNSKNYRNQKNKKGFMIQSKNIEPKVKKLILNYDIKIQEKERTNKTNIFKRVRRSLKIKPVPINNHRLISIAKSLSNDKEGDQMKKRHLNSHNSKERSVMLPHLQKYLKSEISPELKKCRLIASKLTEDKSYILSQEYLLDNAHLPSSREIKKRFPNKI